MANVAAPGRRVPVDPGAQPARAPRRGLADLPRTGGDPVRRSLAERFHAQVDHSIADVQVHRGSAVDHAARLLEASAFTLGRHVYVSSRAAHPATTAGRRLLAHELGHVAQSAPGAEVLAGTTVTRATQAQESEASVVGDLLSAGGTRPTFAPLRLAPGRGVTLGLGGPKTKAPVPADQVERAMTGAGAGAAGAAAGLAVLGTLGTADLVTALVELDRRGLLEQIAGAIRFGDQSAVAGATFVVMYLSTSHRSTPAWGILAARVIASLSEADRTDLLERVLRATGRADQIEPMKEGLAALEESETARAAQPVQEVGPDAPPVSASVLAGVAMAPWNPGGQPIPFYLGNAAHVAIAAYYAGLHPTDAAFYNFTPVSQILAAAATLGIQLGKAAATAVQLGLKPDIANITRLHLFEIKPATLQALGRTEARLYQAAFVAAGLPIALGPVGEPGTAGTVPAPGGWYEFRAPEAGVVTYNYRQPPRRRVRVRAPVREPAPEPVPDRSLRERIGIITGLSGTALTIYLIISEGSRVIPFRNAIPVP